MHKLVDAHYSYKRNTQFTGRYTYWFSTQPNPADKHKLFDAPPSCELYCDLVTQCMMEKDYAGAERDFKTAANMIPTRLTPNYFL